jgi:hypothetical protein
VNAIQRDLITNGISQVIKQGIIELTLNAPCGTGNTFLGAHLIKQYMDDKPDLMALFLTILRSSELICGYYSDDEYGAKEA